MYVTSGGSCGNETEFGKRERARRASQHERNLRVRQYVRVIYAFGYTLVCGVRQRMALGTVIYVSAKPALGVPSFDSLDLRLSFTGRLHADGCPTDGARRLPTMRPLLRH
jgi:hypothetical protein